VVRSRDEGASRVAQDVCCIGGQRRRMQRPRATTRDRSHVVSRAPSADDAGFSTSSALISNYSIIA
jgi:hypothetical protein